MDKVIIIVLSISCFQSVRSIVSSRMSILIVVSASTFAEVWTQKSQYIYKQKESQQIHISKTLFLKFELPVKQNHSYTTSLNLDFDQKKWVSTHIFVFFITQLGTCLLDTIHVTEVFFCHISYSHDLKQITYLWLEKDETLLFLLVFSFFFLP